MADTDKQLAKAIEIENRFTDIRAQIKHIGESILTLTEIMGVVFDEVYEMEKMIDEPDRNFDENHWQEITDKTERNGG